MSDRIFRRDRHSGPLLFTNESEFKKAQSVIERQINQGILNLEEWFRSKYQEEPYYVGTIFHGSWVRGDVYESSDIDLWPLINIDEPWAFDTSFQSFMTRSIKGKRVNVAGYLNISNYEHVNILLSGQHPVVKDPYIIITPYPEVMQKFQR